MSSMDSVRLRELIRAVRGCKTASEERELINKESAKIREGFKENTPYLRTRNMLKLLYIRMLGYPTEFGQLEVINLLSQEDFCGKRIGYLALQLLLDERDEVLTLAENRLKTDLNCQAILTQAVALNAAANVASEDMSRDIFDDIVRMFHPDTVWYIKNKVHLTAMRMVKKCPEHAEFFLGNLTTVFDENSASPLQTGIALLNQCLQTEEAAQFIMSYRKLATKAVRLLKELVLSSHSSQYDVGTVCNPYLQCRLLTFMRIIGKGSSVTSEALNDVLAQVITNTDFRSTAGCAVLYECVRTISGIESDDGLRMLAVNTMGRFLAAVRDNNLRFVALQTLLDFVRFDFAAVQQHQAVVLDCLKDPDVSIRRRAFALTVQLITEENIRLLVPDLITYLGLCQEELKAEVTEQLCDVVEKRAPTEEWMVDMALKLLRNGNQYAPEAFAIKLIAVVSNQPEDVQTRAVKTIWNECAYIFDALHQLRRSFLIAALWCLGEFPDYLYKVNTAASPEVILESVTEMTVNTNYGIVKQYGLTALMKLAARYPHLRSNIIDTFRPFTKSLDCELQQRAGEYTVLLNQFPELVEATFARMPPMQVGTASVPVDDVHPLQIVTNAEEPSNTETTNVLDDLFDFGSGPTAAGAPEGARSPAATAATAPTQPAAATASSMDDLFGGGGGAVASSAAPSSGKDDLFGPSAPHSVAGGTCVHETADFSAWLSATRDGTSINARVMIVSKCSTPIQSLVFQAAVPKTCTLVPSPLPDTSIAPGSQLTQTLYVDNTHYDTPDRLMLLIKISYVVDQTPREETFRVSTTV